MSSQDPLDLSLGPEFMSFLRSPPLPHILIHFGRTNWAKSEVKEVHLCQFKHLMLRGVAVPRSGRWGLTLPKRSYCMMPPKHIQWTPNVFKQMTSWSSWDIYICISDADPKCSPVAAAQIQNRQGPTLSTCLSEVAKKMKLWDGVRPYGTLRTTHNNGEQARVLFYSQKNWRVHHVPYHVQLLITCQTGNHDFPWIPLISIFHLIPPTRATWAALTCLKTSVRNWSRRTAWRSSWILLIQYDPILSNMIQYDPIWFNMIQYDPMNSCFCDICDAVLKLA